jgi:tetratricopeptide (TPR) repeat protein
VQNEDAFTWIEHHGAAAEPAGTLAERAATLERAHRLHDARETVDRALRRAADLPLARLVDGLLHARAGDHGRAAHRFASLFERQDAPQGIRIRAGYELARACDRMGRYDEAMATLHRTKEIQRRNVSPALARRARSLRRQKDALGEAITADDLRSFDAEPQTRLALLTGFPRTGSTLLESALDRHSDLVSIEESNAILDAILRPLAREGARERSLLEMLRELTPRQASACRERYRRQLSSLAPEPIAGRLPLDKNPSYMPALPLLQRLFPGLKTIVTLRDPRDVVLSCYMMHRDEVTPFNVAFLGWQETAQEAARTLRLWLRVRDLLAGDFVEARYEELVADLPGELRRVLAYLDLPWTEAVLDYRRRARERPATSPTYAEVTRPIYTRSIGRWRRYECHLASVLPTLGPLLRRLGYT